MTTDLVTVRAACACGTTFELEATRYETAWLQARIAEFWALHGADHLAMLVAAGAPQEVHQDIEPDFEAAVRASSTEPKVAVFREV